LNVSLFFSKNVVNFIVGGAKTSSALCSDERIKGVFFTGSKPVGLKILEVTHKHLDKMVALEPWWKKIQPLSMRM
jgi:succinylglutamic semialdehyde dehydrogenase